jgi:hypothetical protein
MSTEEAEFKLPVSDVQAIEVDAKIGLSEDTSVTTVTLPSDPNSVLFILAFAQPKIKITTNTKTNFFMLPPIRILK